MGYGEQDRLGYYLTTGGEDETSSAGPKGAPLHHSLISTIHPPTGRAVQRYIIANCGACRGPLLFATPGPDLYVCTADSWTRGIRTEQERILSRSSERYRFTGAYSISENDESYSVPYRILSKYEREEPAGEPWPTPYSCIRDMT